MSSKRHPTHAPPPDQSGPKPPVNFSSSLTIADSAVLVGTHSITIQSECVIHHLARLESRIGSILIGRRCVIEERSKLGGIHNETAPSSQPDDRGGVILGDYVSIKVGAVVEAGGTEIGDGTTVGERAMIGAGAKIGKNCVIAAHEVVKAGEVILDSTVVFSNGLRKRNWQGMQNPNKRAQLCEIDLLRRLIPSRPEKFAPATS